MCTLKYKNRYLLLKYLINCCLTDSLLISISIFINLKKINLVADIFQKGEICIGIQNVNSFRKWRSVWEFTMLFLSIKPMHTHKNNAHKLFSRFPQASAKQLRAFAIVQSARMIAIRFERSPLLVQLPAPLIIIPFGHKWLQIYNHIIAWTLSWLNREKIMICRHVGSLR